VTVVSTHLVLIVLLAECGALVVGFTLLIGHGVWTAARHGRLEPRRAAARDAIVAGLVERPDEALPLSVLDGLPASERRLMLGHPEPGITGQQRAALLDLADRAGVLSGAERCCRSRRWRRRLQGVRIYTLLGGGRETVPRLFADRRPEVRAEAATWAAEHPQPETVSQLVALLGDEATLCRFMVKDSLLRLGSAAVEPLDHFLSTVSATGTAAAAGLEVAAALGDPRLLDAGFRSADSPDPRVRHRAVQLLGALGGEDAFQALVTCLDDPAPEVRAAAARALGAGRQWSAGASIAAALRDPSWEVRQEAGIALLRLGPAGELLLRRMLADGDSFARDMSQLMLDLPFVPA
jgi:HEAT repeat protein